MITVSPTSRPCSAATLWPITNFVNVAYLPGKGLIRPDNTHHVSIGFTHLFTSNVIGETRLGFSRAFLARQSDGDRTSTNYAAELGLKNLAANPGEYTLPSVNLTGYAPGNPTGTSGFVGYGLRIVQNNLYYRAGQTFTWVRNRHTLKFGGDVSRLMVGYDQGSNQNGIFNFSGNFTGDAFGDYLLGMAQSANGGLGSFGQLRRSRQVLDRHPVSMVHSGRLESNGPTDSEPRTSS